MYEMLTIVKGCNNSWIAELNTSWYVGFQQLLFLSYYFFEFDEFVFSGNI